jgi:hypothetical protein
MHHLIFAHSQEGYPATRIALVTFYGFDFLVFLWVALDPSVIVAEYFPNGWKELFHGNDLIDYPGQRPVWYRFQFVGYDRFLIRRKFLSKPLTQLFHILVELQDFLVR